MTLTEEAAKSFRFGRLTLTKGEQTVMETTLGLEGIQRTSDNKRLLTVTFASAVIDDGELVIWSNAIKGQPIRLSEWGVRRLPAVDQDYADSDEGGGWKVGKKRVPRTNEMSRGLRTAYVTIQ